MKSLWLRIWRVLRIVLRGVLFLALFAFALNNAQPVTVSLFFGLQWSQPLVLVVLLAFTVGVAIGALGVLPRLWRRPAGADTSAAPVAPEVVPGKP